MSIVASSPDFGSFQESVGAIADRMNSNLGHLDFAQSFDTVATMLCGVHAGFFAAQADPNGDPWKAISNKTADSRYLRDLGGGGIGSGKIGKTREAAARAVGFVPDHTILIDSGAMKSSVAFRGNADHVEQITPLEMSWGTKDPKAETHQFGSITNTYNEREERWVTIEVPPRPFVGWSLNAIDSALDTVADGAVTSLLVGI